MKKVSFLPISVLVLISTACGSKTESAQSKIDEAETTTIEEVTSETETLIPTESASDESTSSEFGKDVNNAKIDKMLDAYEAMIEEYDKYVTKLKSGDVDMNSAMNMATKAQSMQENLEAMESNMNAKQIQRLTKLISKLSTIAAKAATINTNDIKSVNGVDLQSLGM